MKRSAQPHAADNDVRFMCRHHVLSAAHNLACSAAATTMDRGLHACTIAPGFLVSPQVTRELLDESMSRSMMRWWSLADRVAVQRFIAMRPLVDRIGHWSDRVPGRWDAAPSQSPFDESHAARVPMPMTGSRTLSSGVGCKREQWTGPIAGERENHSRPMPPARAASRPALCSLPHRASRQSIEAQQCGEK